MNVISYNIHMKIINQILHIQFTRQHNNNKKTTTTIYYTTIYLLILLHIGLIRTLLHGNLTVSYSRILSKRVVFPQKSKFEKMLNHISIHKPHIRYQF